ncbi:hypothetical protein COCC4DRAFT_76470 [Bipolaris maydis ATCC 48331]|uniref:Cytochrome P450 n=2 Tax=Cochliobolus heterostrophus TaxID=5016 RepID=M2SIT3_COCH5|nr:uncharacterized protein COCC4DRAFT_76470 [Bipolaris maydis ATCC 48331]EMD85265.1 hypothetical protein COCHEDRAFT_1199015 [Bipolaris maydis C5]KAJ5023990.1 cytochrome P450 [Bipolaris maydis]ENH99508.1 hypothetical protein COCC4DRAFT_76470 [Bipolaris maydis ATCC 48331]KAJ5023997.1 cytochrome P450 [Bipolaris maydis]KAJ5058056.1 cytochrome P450 6A1 [Bipolaris maydis]
MAIFDSIPRVATYSPLISLCISVILVSMAIMAIIVISTIAHRLLTRRIPHDAPPEVRDNYPVIGPWGFWKRRWDWYKERISQSETGNFSFHAGPSMVVGLSGDTARKVFFESRQLHVGQGYAAIDGAPTNVDKIHDGQDTDEGIEKWFIVRLKQLLKSQYLQDRLPDLVVNVSESIDTIQKDPTGIINPFDNSISHVIYKLAIDMFGPNEFVSDPEKLKQTQSMFVSIDTISSPTSMIFPKLPSFHDLKKFLIGARLFFMLQSTIKKRATSGKKHNDAMQILLDQGQRIFRITIFVFGAVLSGLANSTMNSASIISYLAAAPEWQDKVRQEVREVAAKYTRDTNAPLRQQLADIPMKAWEPEFPLFSACLRDSIRLHIVPFYFRKNMSGSDIPLGNDKEVIPEGAIVAYPSYDIHLDPNVYANPHEWDSTRYMPGRSEDTKKPHGYVGWGSGLHPCIGMPAATLQITLIAAYFVASFDFQLVDKNGNRLSKVSGSDVNQTKVTKPKNPPYVKVISREK